MFLINQKGEAKIVTEKPDAKVKENIARGRGGGRVVKDGGWKDGGWWMERMTSREGRRDKVGRHVAAPARRGSPIVLRNRLCLITSNWLAVDNASG